MRAPLFSKLNVLKDFPGKASFEDDDDKDDGEDGFDAFGEDKRRDNSALVLLKKRLNLAR